MGGIYTLRWFVCQIQSILPYPIFSTMMVMIVFYYYYFFFNRRERKKRRWNESLSRKIMNFICNNVRASISNFAIVVFANTAAKWWSWRDWFFCKEEEIIWQVLLVLLEIACHMPIFLWKKSIRKIKSDKVKREKERKKMNTAKSTRNYKKMAVFNVISILMKD